MQDAKLAKDRVDNTKNAPDIQHCTVTGSLLFTNNYVPREGEKETT